MGKKFKVGGGTTNYFCAVFGHSSQASQNYYIAILVERQVWFGEKNCAKVINSAIKDSLQSQPQNFVRIFNATLEKKFNMAVLHVFYLLSLTLKL